MSNTLTEVERSDKGINRRTFLGLGTASAVAALGAMAPEWAKIAEAAGFPFEKGKYQTFPRLWVEGDNDSEPKRVLQQIDLGTLGPDVDTIAGIDFDGDIPTGALVISSPESGVVEETRVVFIKRADLETVQLKGALGGDRFDVYKISENGGDPLLDQMARLHATNTARKHQKVVYLGDLGLFERQWGKNEGPLLKALIRAQRPANKDLGIVDPDFVNPRKYQ